MPGDIPTEHQLLDKPAGDIAVHVRAFRENLVLCEYETLQTGEIRFLRAHDSNDLLRDAAMREMRDALAILVRSENPFTDPENTATNVLKLLIGQMR